LATCTFPSIGLGWFAAPLILSGRSASQTSQGGVVTETPVWMVLILLSICSRRLLDRDWAQESEPRGQNPGPFSERLQHLQEDSGSALPNRLRVVAHTCLALPPAKRVWLCTVVLPANGGEADAQAPTQARTQESQRQPWRSSREIHRRERRTQPQEQGEAREGDKDTPPGWRRHRRKIRTLRGRPLLEDRCTTCRRACSVSDPRLPAMHKTPVATTKTGAPN
jgi:hypothetical protein